MVGFYRWEFWCYHLHADSRRGKRFIDGSFLPGIPSVAGFITLFCLVFFTTHRYAVRFALAQEVLRLLTLSCSVTLFPMIIVGLGMSVISLNITLFILSEIVKIGSLIFVIKKCNAGDGVNKFLPLTERDYIERALRLAQKDMRKLMASTPGANFTYV